MSQSGDATRPTSKQRGHVRMASAQRREQLITIARGLFAERGFEGTAVEEIAARAEVSKPVVYEHFGGKEGLYAIVVDREVTTLEQALLDAITVPGASYREIIERGTLALLDYIDASPDGFRIISRDSAVGSTSGSFASILNDVATRVHGLVEAPLQQRGYDPALAGIFSQALVGLVAMAGQSWLDNRTPAKEEVAAQLVNLAWFGLRDLRKDASLLTELDPATEQRIRRRSSHAAHTA